MARGNKKTVDFQIKRFDINRIGDSKIIIFIGKRNTGKSFLVVDYLYHNQDIPIGTVISPTDEFNETYKPHVPSVFIHEEYSEELIANFLKRQKQITKKTKDPQYRELDPRAFLILDDCQFDNTAWIKDRNIKWIFMNGRHAKITFIITMQYLLGIPPGLRTQVDFLFICKEPKVSNRKKLYEHYAGMFPNFDMFDQVMRECTKNYCCLVIDNTTISEKLSDQVFWYKASDHGNFRLCYDEFWVNNDEVSCTEEEDIEEEEDDFIKYTNRPTKMSYRIDRGE